MDSSDSMQQSTFSEEEKLPEVIDEDASWFDKNLGEESDNTEEHEELNTQINQDDLGVDLDIVKDSDLGDKVGDKSVGDDVEADSKSNLLEEVNDNPHENSNESPLESKKDDLAELKDIAIDSKKHDISNELKEMFEEKSSDAEEMNESAIAEHSLDEEITKEDKLKDIVPDDILGKDDSFDGLDNALHQELAAHLTYEKNKELISDLPDNVDLNDVSTSQVNENKQADSQLQLKTEPDIHKSLDDLSFETKTELLKDLAENIGVKEIDDMMEQNVPSEEDCSQKEENNSELRDISSGLEDSCVSELKDDLENQLQNITGETSEDLQSEQEHVSSAEIVTHVDKSNIELNQANMMVEFAHDNSNQVLIQINTDHTETPPEQPQNSDSLIMKTSDGQTLVFSTETLKSETSSDNDVVSQVEGGAEFLEAVTGKLEDVLTPVNKEEQKVEPDVPEKSVAPVIEPIRTTVSEKEPVKEDRPKCCITTCKSGKSSLKTTYRYFKPPVNKLLYKKWEYIFNQAKQQISPTSLICELHFRTGLIYKRGINRNGNVIWALREGALPKLSPSGVLRASGGMIPPPSTTVQVPKRPEGIVKSPPKPDPPVTEPTKVPKVPTLPSTVPKALSSGKKILQKPVKTVATKVSNEITDIGFLYKNPELVRVAQEELITQDILVCGECHSVFHILELFQAHKMANNCQGQSNFKGNPSEPKPPVWAFLLWKSAQAKLSDIESSWKLYQRWCKMDESIRNAWIAAGKFLQEGHSVASLKLIDSPIRPNKVGRPPLRDKYSEDEDEEFTIRRTKRPKIQAIPRNASPQVPDVEMDMGGAGDAPASTEQEEMEVENTHEEPAQPLVEANEVEQTLQDLSRHTPEMLTTEVEIKQEILSDDESGENKENDSDLRKNKSQQQTVPEKQKDPEKDEEEFVVEKIVSRRYNIKKKHYEYLLKWEGYPSEQNTWEPAENLGTCQHLLKAFEEALAKQQAAKMAARGLAPPLKQETPYKVKPPVIPKKKEPLTPGPSTPALNITSGRPIRSSKKKAMDQVKVWCGSIVKPSEDDSVGLKRKVSSDSEYEEEVVVKKVKVEGRVKFEQESEDSESGSERFAPRGRGKMQGSAKLPLQSPLASRNNPVVNGEPKESNLAAALGLESDEEEDHTAVSAASSPLLQKSPQTIQKMSSLSPQSQKVLVASAKGVVKVDPKQVPNLSSGVYIMSNKSGIVKVDNTKTLNSLQKSGIMKKPLGTLSKPVNPSVSPTKPNSGVVILPKSEPNTPQQKVGVVRRGPVPASQATPTITTPAITTPVSATPATTTAASTTPASTTSSSQTPARPAGVLKPKTGILPRPLGMLKPASPGSTPVATPSTPLTRPLGIPAGINSKIQQVRPRTPATTTPVRGRPVATPLLRKPLTDSPNLQASAQQKLLIAKKKAEAVALKPSVTISPVKSAPGSGLTEIRSRVEASPGGMLPIRSTNKVLAHPMLNRGRGRGFRGRGRGSSLAQLVQRELPEVVKESKLVDSDNLLMEFQEQSDSEESDDGVEDIFNIADLPPIEPESPPRHLTLCPLTGKRLAKAEGEKTPEPTPPPSPKPPTPPPVKEEEPKEEPTHILPDHEDEAEMATSVPVQAPPSPVPVTSVPSRVPPTPVPTTNTAIVKQEGMICKVEMSPGGTTGTLVEAIADTATPAGVTEGTVTIKKPLASRNRINRGPQLSVMPTNSTSTSLGTITVPAKKLFQEENGDDDMVTITGEDGLVYQVSNSELTGNTLLVSSGEDGQQQCVYVTTDADGTEDGSTILTLDTAYADAVAQLGSDQVNILSTENGDQFYIKEGDDEGQLMTLEGEEGMITGDDQSGQVVAQLVEAGEPAPGGSRRVVLLLPDGNLMMTEVDEEQYAALDLDK